MLTDQSALTCLKLPHSGVSLMYNRFKIIFGSQTTKSKIITARFSGENDPGLSMNSCGDPLSPVRALIEFCDELDSNSDYICAGQGKIHHTFTCQLFCNDKSSVASFQCNCPKKFCPAAYLILRNVKTICEISVWV